LSHTQQVQFISASPPSTEYVIWNAGTGSDGGSCHQDTAPTSSRKQTKYKWCRL